MRHGFRIGDMNGLSLGEMKVYFVIGDLYKAELIFEGPHYVVYKAQGREICGWEEGLANFGLHSVLCYWSMLWLRLISDSFDILSESMLPSSFLIDFLLMSIKLTMVILNSELIITGLPTLISPKAS